MSRWCTGFVTMMGLISQGVNWKTSCPRYVLSCSIETKEITVCDRCRWGHCVHGTKLLLHWTTPDFLDPFQLGFRPGFVTETALVTLDDDLHPKRERKNVSCWFSMDPSSAVSPCPGSRGWVWVTLFHSGSSDSSWRMNSQKWYWGILFDLGFWHDIPQGFTLLLMLFSIYLKWVLVSLICKWPSAQSWCASECQRNCGNLRHNAFDKSSSYKYKYK